MEEKIAVIYKSKYGSTKRYAGWIALKLNADLYEISDIRDKDLDEYNTIVYGGPIYVGKIKGLNFITKNYENIKNKKVIVFAVGMKSYNEEYVNTIIDSNLSEEIKKTIKPFYFRGVLNYSELGIIDKILMKGLKKDIQSKEKLSEDEKMILKSFEEPMDLCDKKSIEVLLEYINVINTEK